MINKLQNYYGIAMRACTGKSMEELNRDIGAALSHCCEVDNDEQRHMFCPKTPLSWCKHQSDICNGSSFYKHKPGIHRKIFPKMKPVFMELSNDDLLKNCLHGKTHNLNESINGVIWKECLKEECVSRPTLEMDIDSAVIDFNDGANRIPDVIKDYGLREVNSQIYFV